MPAVRKEGVVHDGVVCVVRGDRLHHVLVDVLGHSAGIAQSEPDVVLRLPVVFAPDVFDESVLEGRIDDGPCGIGVPVQADYAALT